MRGAVRIAKVVVDVGGRELAGEPGADHQAVSHPQRDGQGQARGCAPERVGRGRLDRSRGPDRREGDSLQPDPGADAEGYDPRDARADGEAEAQRRGADLDPDRLGAVARRQPVSRLQPPRQGRVGSSHTGAERELVSQWDLPRDRHDGPERSDVYRRSRLRPRRRLGTNRGHGRPARRRRRPVGDRRECLRSRQRLALAGANSQRREPDDRADLLAPQLVEPVRQRDPPDHEPVGAFEREPRLRTHPEIDPDPQRAPARRRMAELILGIESIPAGPHQRRREVRELVGDHLAQPGRAGRAGDDGDLGALRRLGPVRGAGAPWIAGGPRRRRSLDPESHQHEQDEPPAAPCAAPHRNSSSRRWRPAGS